MISEWPLIIFLILISGLFSGSEIGFVAANRLKLELRSRKESFTAKHLSFFIRNPETFLSTTLIGNNIVNILYATLMTIFLAEPIRQLWQYAGLGAQPPDFTFLIIQTFIASILILIFGEVIPKSIFRIHADRLVPVMATPMAFTNMLFRPLIWTANTISQKLVRFFQPDSETVLEFFRREDIETLFREIGTDNSEHSDIDRDDSELLTNVLELSNKRVKETMIPRTEIVAVEKNSTLDEVLDTFINSGYSKLPVYDGNIDNIVGVIFAYDLFKNPKSVDAIIRPVKHVPYSQKSTTLLSEFKRQNVSLAVVIDEYGGTAGLVTIEDLIEEVVGDIQDEYDTEETIMKRLNDGSFILSGNVEVDDLEDEFPEIQLFDEDDDFETIAGYIINQIGRIPLPNEEVILNDKKFIITKATNSRIEIVKLVMLD